LSACGVLFEQLTGGVEFQLDFDALEAAVFTNENLAGMENVAAFFILDAEVVVQVHATFDDFSAAVAFDGEGVIALLWFGRSAEEFFEEVHGKSFPV
jgi:hypothetical protein